MAAYFTKLDIVYILVRFRYHMDINNVIIWYQHTDMSDFI